MIFHRWAAGLVFRRAHWAVNRVENRQILGTFNEGYLNLSNEADIPELNKYQCDSCKLHPLEGVQIVSKDVLEKVWKLKMTNYSN